MSTPRPLIVRLCNMVGDTVLSIPALKLLEAHGYELHLYGKGWAAGLLAGHGWHCIARAGSLSERIAQLRDLRRQCLAKDPGFDQRANTLVMPNSFSSAFEARWAGLRPAGYARDGRSLLLSRREDPRHGPHALEGFWQLACSFLGVQQAPPERIDMAVAPNDQAAADALLAERGIAPGFICVVPFAAGVVDKMDKKWPHFAPLCQALQASGHTLVACPGPGETDLEQAGFEQVIALPDVKLGTYLGILRRAALVISNDTGPAHMAAAVGAPTLSVLGPTKPEQWRPWGPTVTVVSHKPDWPSVEAVMHAMEDHRRQPATPDTPWLSIVIPAYNVAQLIGDTMRSLQQQDLNGVEILIGDDASTDETVRVIESIQRQTGLPIRMFPFPSNRGQATVRNELFAEAQGTYIWFFDSDDLMAPDAIRDIRVIVERDHPDWIGMDFRMLRDKMTFKHRLRGEFHRSSCDGVTPNTLCTDRVALLRGLFSAGQLHPWSRVIQRELLSRQSGPFKQGIFFEDVHLIPRVAAQVRSYVHIDRPLVAYRQHATSTLRTMNPKKILDMATCLIDVRQVMRQLPEMECDAVRDEYDHYAAKMYIGACRHATKTDQPDSLLAQIGKTLPDTLLSPVRTVLMGYLKRLWLWRAARLAYWAHNGKMPARFQKFDK